MNKSGNLNHFDPMVQERRVIQRVIAGEVDLFDDLVTKYRDLVFRFLLKTVKEPSVAEDLLQDTFLEGFRKLDAFQGRSKFSTWLIGIAINISRNYFARSPDIRFNSVSHEDLNLEDKSRQSPLEDLENKIFVSALEEGIDSLPDDLRTSVILVCLEGMSYEEAAQAMNLPLGTMKSRLFRAREILRQIVKKHLQD